MRKIKSYLILAICVSCVLSFGQNQSIDSLKLALKNAKHDTTKLNLRSDIGVLASVLRIGYWDSLVNDAGKINHKKVVATSLNNIGFIFYSHGDIPKALEYFHKGLKIRTEIGNKHGVAESLINIGQIYRNQGDMTRVLEYTNKSLKIQEEIGDKKGIALSLINIGQVYQFQGNIPKALEYFGMSLKIREKLGDKKGMASAMVNIGSVYSAQDEVTKALEYYEQSLKTLLETNDKYAIANSLNNIGVIYSKWGDPLVTSSKDDALRSGIPKALEYFEKSLKIREDITDKLGIAQSLNNIGQIYDKQGDIFKAMGYYEKGLNIQEETGDKQGVAYTLNNIGSLYSKQKNYSKALELNSKSIKLSKELGFPENIRNAAKDLSQIYKATGNHKLALENYELYILMRDSINNESTRKASIKSQLKYEYEKQAAADSVAHAKESEIKNAELAKQKAEISAKKNQQYALFGGLGLVMIFAGFMYNRFKVTQKQKGIIEEQKEVVEEQKKLVEEKQKEILDSIHYARRIQMAQIPSEKQVRKNLERLRKN